MRYQRTRAARRSAVESLRGYLDGGEPVGILQDDGRSFPALGGQNAAKAAIDIALMDWVGKKLNVPLYRYFGLDPQDAP